MLFCSGGLSNYLYVASLKPGIPVDNISTPKKVLVRVYGELLRSNMNSVVLDAVIFALISEKRLGPKLYGVFPGGRIEEFVEVSWDNVLTNFCLIQLFSSGLRASN